MVSLSTPSSTASATFVRLLARDLPEQHYADDDPENQNCRSLIDPSVVKMCKGDLIAMVSITLWIVLLVWFWFSGYKRLKAYYRAKGVSLPCLCMRRKSKSNGMPKLKPLRAGTELRREKPQGGVPGPVDPYMVVPRRLSDSLIAPTRPPTTPPPTYHPSSRKSIHDPASYAFSGRTTADAHAASPRSSLRFSAVGLGFCETVPLPSPALTTDQSFLNFASELRETSTPRRDSVDRRSSASPGASPKSASGNGQKKEGWVMIETV